MTSDDRALLTCSQIGTPHDPHWLHGSHHGYECPGEPAPAATAAGELIRLRNRIAALEENGAELLRRTEKAEATVAEYEGAETWGTSCLACARVLDASIADHERAEIAEAAVERVKALRDHWRWTHAIDAANELSAALSAPESPPAASTAVSAATEAHGGAGEAQEG